MAKNKVYSQINQYANREEEIRKAKGNPNKNNHAKKKNSNYGGYSTSVTAMAANSAISVMFSHMGSFTRSCCLAFSASFWVM